MRITKVYTKTGDAGETSLVSGDRVSKASLRVSAFGDVDELNSAIGVARSFLNEPEMDKILGTIQNELFILGADLASPSEIKVPRIDAELVSKIENLIDKLLSELAPLTEFILPSGNQAGAMLHLARTIARRAERVTVALTQVEEINPQALIYLNRMSDFLFVIARVVNNRGGVPEHLANFSQRGK
jgi:cob(I)alamin adenosyltransferase